MKCNDHMASISPSFLFMQFKHICTQDNLATLKNEMTTLYLIETTFKAFANIADPDQAALVRAG